MGTILLALPLTLVWVGLTSRLTLENVVIGFAVSIAVISLGPPRRLGVQPGQLPAQFLALILYIALLFRDIVLSSIDVARRVLSPSLPLKPGVVAVATQDPDHDPTVAALSSMHITLTPGELVIEVEDDHVMYVHTLDVDVTTAHARQTQAQRLGLLRQISGRSS